MPIEKITEKVKGVEGWFTNKEGALAYHLIKQCRGRGVIVEIGSWKGKSTIWLAQASKEHKQMPVYAIDPHADTRTHEKTQKSDTFEDFKHNIKKGRVDDIVVPLVKTSETAAADFDKPVEFIFIDGAHKYELVKLDFELWFPKVMNGGFMMFHDTMSRSGPRRVVREYMYKSRFFKNIGFVDSVTFGQKVKQNTWKDRLRNRYVLLLKDIAVFAGNLPIPKPIKTKGKQIVKLLHH